MRIGCHISVSKGFSTAVRNAHELGAQCFQYFTKSPRMLRFTKKLDREDADRGVALQKDLGLISLGHAPYLINLSAPEEDMRRASVDALLWDLEVAKARGTYAVVVHCGKHKGEGVEAGIERMREALTRVMTEDQSGVLLLLENTAGQGSELGTTVDELLTLVEGIADPDRLGFCLDTQHAFAAGILNPEAADWFPELNRPAFRERLRAVHFNDSKVPHGHHADRHAKIGQGAIGEVGLTRILTDARIHQVPFYLETPVADEKEYQDEMVLCHRLAGE